VKRSMIF